MPAPAYEIQANSLLPSANFRKQCLLNQFRYKIMNRYPTRIGLNGRHMSEEYSIVQIDKPDDSAWEVIGGGIHRYNAQKAGDDQGKQMCFILYGPNHEIAGGLIGETHWGWLYINLLFVKEELRGRGYGHSLLTLAEDEARKLGVTNAYLDTFSFQAPDFYKQHGYQIFGELREFPVKHQRYYLTKQL